MSSAGFYIAAVLVVLSCAAAVGLRGARQSAVAAVAVAVSIGIFLVVGHEYLLALLEVVLLIATLGAVVEMGRRGAFGPPVRPPFSRWLPAAGVAVLAAVVLDGTALAAGGGWHRSGIETALSSVLDHQAPVTTGLLVVVGVAAVLVALAIGRSDPDEAEHVERHRARQEREAMLRRRRDDRAAARAKRQAATPGGGG